jgi:hypothetical protein
MNPIESCSTRELLANWGAILLELRSRGIVRTANNPIGDIAEALVALHYKGAAERFLSRAGTLIPDLKSYK